MKWKLASFALLLMLTVSFISSSSAEETTPEAGPAPTSFSLNDLYAMALHEAETIRSAEENVLIAEKDKQRAMSVLIPRFTAFGDYSMTDYDQSTDPADYSEIPGQSDVSIGTDTMGWGVRFDQSFTLNGKELTALSITKENIEKSNLDLRTTKESYLFEVANAYFNVLRAHKGWEIAKASVKRLQKHRDAVSARLKLEDVTKTDMFRAESELSDAKSQLIADQNTFIYAKAALRSLVNLPTDFELHEPPEESDNIMIPDVESLVENGLAVRTEIKSAKKQQSVSEKSVKIAKGDYWPTLSIEGQYRDQDDAFSKDLDYDKDSTAFMVGAKLTFTLFDGGLRSAEITQAKARERQARLGLEELRKQIRLEIENAYLLLITQKGRLVSLKDKLSFSQQNYLAVTEQFKHGLSNSVDMMDANTILVSAERELSDAWFGYRLAHLKLKRTTGSFLDETLADLTQE